MAVLISTADGNLTAASGWNTIEGGTGASQTTRSASTNTTTSYVYSSAFTGTNTNVCDGLLLYCNRVNTTGTVDVALSEDNGTTATRSLQVNASDLPVSPSWVFFKFASTLTLDGGVDYKVGIKGSSAGNATFYRNATAGNWTRILRLTATATAAAGDVMYIVGEHTGAGATTTRTITMDSTATTDYGTGTDGAADNGIEIGDAGVLTYGTTAATNYYLKLSGSLNVWANGTLNIGTTGTPIPRDSTAVLEFDPVADGGMGLIISAGGTLNMQGQSRTSGKNIVSCKLNTDEAINSTSLGVDTDTGWLDNDEIAIASTTRTATQCEKGTLNGNAGVSSLTVDGFGGVGGGVANAHSGTSPTQAEVVLLTRNVRLRSATSTIATYTTYGTTSTVDIDWAEFYYVGASASGMQISNTTGTFSMQYSSIHDGEGIAMNISGSSPTSVTVSNNVIYNTNTGLQSASIIISASGSNVTFTNNVMLLLYSATSGSNTSAGVVLSSVSLNFSGNTIAGANTGSTNGALHINHTGTAFGTFSNNTIHSSSGPGIKWHTTTYGTMTSTTIWRNTGNGIDLTGSTMSVGTLVIDSGTLFGNSTNISIGMAGVYVLKSLTVNSDSSFTTSIGVNATASINSGDIYIMNSSFGSTTTHTSLDLNIASSTSLVKFILHNCTLSSTETTTLSAIAPGAYFRSNRHDGSATTHKSLYKYGTIASNQSVRHTSSGFSWSMTPASAVNKLIFPGPIQMDTLKAAVNASSAVTISAWVQKDGSYNGNAPRLVLVGGMIEGIASDVTDSLSVGASTWEQLTVTGTPSAQGVVEFYIDCDGTAGNVYVDDITVTQ